MEVLKFMKIMPTSRQSELELQSAKSGLTKMPEGGAFPRFAEVHKKGFELFTREKKGTENLVNRGGDLIKVTS